MSEAATPWRVLLDASAEVAAVFEPALPAATGALFICAHGAGGHMEDQGVLGAARELRRRGFDVVRFNFPYRQNGSRVPDPMPRLKRCYGAVAEYARKLARPDLLILGGRSMGGRVASLLAAEAFACDGLLLFAYPLHPAGHPEKLRDAHLHRISVPVLCFNGTRDALCRRDLMEQTVRGFDGRWSQHWLEGADHSLHVLKTSGRTDQDVLIKVGAQCAPWLAALPRR